MADPEAKPDSSNRVQIIIALIGLAGSDRHRPHFELEQYLSKKVPTITAPCGHVNGIGRNEEIGTPGSLQWPPRRSRHLFL